MKWCLLPSHFLYMSWVKINLVQLPDWLSQLMLNIGIFKLQLQYAGNEMAWKVEY